jgi:hypothetical protein
VHSVRKVGNLAGYLAAYMSKGSSVGSEYKGKLWGSSFGLSDKNKCEYIADLSELSRVNRCLHNRTIQYKSINSKADYLGRTKCVGELYFIKSEMWRTVINDKLQQQYINHIQKLRSYSAEIPQAYLEYSELGLKNEVTAQQKTADKKVSTPVLEIIDTPVTFKQLSIF